MQDNKLIAECCDAAGEEYASEGFKVEWPEEAAQAAEPVGWRYKKPICEIDGTAVGYSDWIISPDRSFLDWWPHEQLYAAPQPDRVTELEAMLSNADNALLEAGERVGIVYGSDTPRLMADRIEELEAEVARLRKDAERYQWLRDPANQQHEDDICVSDSTFDTYFEDELDAVIDAALAAKGGA